MQANAISVKNLSLAFLAINAAFFGALIHVPVAACSRILLANAGQSVVARTMDLYVSDRARILVYPRGVRRDGGAKSGATKRWESKYGSVTVNSLDMATSDGINEKGFVANLLYLSATKYESRDKRPGVTNAQWAQYMLDNVATVDEALAQLEQVQIVSAVVAGREWPLHLAISDASGNSAVIEFVDGMRIIHRGAKTAVMTNEPPLDVQLKNLPRYKYFGGGEPLPGDIDPISRFVRASAFLKTTSTPQSAVKALELAYNLAKTVVVPDGAKDTSVLAESQDNWPTLWTTLSDSVNRRYFFQSAGSPNMFWVDLNQIDFSERMPIRYLPGNDISLNGDVSRQLKTLPMPVR